MAFLHPIPRTRIRYSSEAQIRTTDLPVTRPESLKRSVDNILEKLRGKKKLDLFQNGRVDSKVPVETSVKTVGQYVTDGKVGVVGMSEVSPKNLRRAAEALGGADKIGALEVEFSLFETSILHNGVAQTCAELGIPIIAYSPLCRGLLVSGHSISSCI